MGYDYERKFKQAAESLVYTIDFSRELESAEAITSVDAFTASPTSAPPLNLGSPSITTNGKKVQARISGGLADETYVITCRVSTNQSNTLEADVKLTIQNK